jgi:hypothetical protein
MPVGKLRLLKHYLYPLLNNYKVLIATCSLTRKRSG